MTDSNKKDNYEELLEEILAEAKSDSQHAQSESDDKGSDLPSDFHSEDEGAMEGKTVRVPADVSSNEYLSKNQSENRLQKSLIAAKQTDTPVRERKGAQRQTIPHIWELFSQRSLSAFQWCFRCL